MELTRAISRFCRMNRLFTEADMAVSALLTKVHFALYNSEVQYGSKTGVFGQHTGVNGFGRHGRVIEPRH